MVPRDIAFTLIGPVLTAWVAVLVLRKKLHRDFPFFFTYLVLSVLIPVLRLSVSGSVRGFPSLNDTRRCAIYIVLTLVGVHYNIAALGLTANARAHCTTREKALRNPGPSR